MMGLLAFSRAPTLFQDILGAFKAWADEVLWSPRIIIFNGFRWISMEECLHFSTEEWLIHRDSFVYIKLTEGWKPLLFHVCLR